MYNFWVILLIFCIVPNRVQNAETSSKLGDVLKNQTKFTNSTRNQENEDNLLFQEAHKFISECGVENYDNNYESDNKKNQNNEQKNSNRYNRDNRNRNQKNRYSNYGNEEDDHYNNRRPGNRHNNENERDEDESNESSNRKTGMRRSNRTNNGYYSNNANNGCNHDFDQNRDRWNEGSYGYEDRNFGRRGVNGPGYNFRTRRSNGDDDSQCVSQCVFGYLEILDDNRSPSETLVVKWLQEHYSNDIKRIRAMREARRCFGKLSSSDVEDGCEFSKSLSKCLNLELE